MSTVKALRETAPSEDVIDTKPEPDDLIDEDLNFVQNPLSRKKPYTKQPDIQNSQVYETGCFWEREVLNSLEETYTLFFRNNSEKMSIEEENFQERKLPVVCSIVKVKDFHHDGEEEEEDDDCGSHTGRIFSNVCQQSLKGDLHFHLLNKLTRI
ncbi:hypothetical protein GH733_013232 [Mirounga leonina]|nr:hypothetical protein GH733_013232 [Mirounga leonina]